MQDTTPDGGGPTKPDPLDELVARLVADGWHRTATGPRWRDQHYSRVAG